MNNSTSYIFFETNFGDIIDNDDIAKLYYILIGDTIDPNDHRKIREFAKRCAGVAREVIPSIPDLIRKGRKYKAIDVFRKTNPGISLSEAKEMIEFLCSES